MIEFGISLGAPTAEPIGDRHDYYRDLLRRGAGTFTSAWLADHLMKDDAPILEAWTALTWLAAEFPNYHFGNLVLSQSYRNPALLAKMAATFQYLSGGRLILGIGAGWQADEYLAYGHPFPGAGTRVAQPSARSTCPTIRGTSRQPAKEPSQRSPKPRTRPACTHRRRTGSWVRRRTTRSSASPP